MSTAPPRQITPEDLLTMPDGDQYELIDGELRELHMSQESSWVAGEVFGRMREFVQARGLGWVFPEGTSYQIFPWDPGRTRRADASFIARERLPEGPIGAGHAHVAPDLAVEVVSPHDSYYDVEEKVVDYLEAGVRLVWVVNPRLRIVSVYRPDAASSPQRLSEGDELTGQDVLPDFRCRVRDLFQRREPVTKPNS